MQQSPDTFPDTLSGYRRLSVIGQLSPPLAMATNPKSNQEDFNNNNNQQSNNQKCIHICRSCINFSRFCTYQSNLVVLHSHQK